MSDLLGSIDIHFIGEIVLKLVTILILSSIIGLERESNNKPAGFRTHILVGMSAVLVVICGSYLHDNTGSDASRIPAQLLSGIGFLGAGTILRNGYSVRGLTTAASLLATTCIGMAIGAGLYVVGIVATIIVFVVLDCTTSIADKFEHRSLLNIKIDLSNPKKNLKDIKEILENYVFETKEIKIPTENTMIISGFLRDDFNRNKIFYKIMEIDDVNDVVEDEEEIKSK